MTINWPLIIVLLGLSLPGIFIAMPRLIFFLLPDNTEELRKRFSRFAIMQALFMVFVMSFAGTVLSVRTGLNDPILTGLLQGTTRLDALFSVLFPSFLYALFGLIGFCLLYYGLASSILDEQSIKVMAKMRAALGLDGCVLYGGVVEEVIARWGLLNVVAFFALLFSRQMNNTIIVLAIILSGIVFAVSQIPVYLAAGCTQNRRVIYTVVLLSLYQSLLFGFLFWQHGLIAAIFGHMLFHLGWGFYDKAQLNNSPKI